MSDNDEQKAPDPAALQAEIYRQADLIGALQSKVAGLEEADAANAKLADENAVLSAEKTALMDKIATLEIQLAKAKNEPKAAKAPKPPKVRKFDLETLILPPPASRRDLFQRLQAEQHDIVFLNKGCEIAVLEPIRVSGDAWLLGGWGVTLKPLGLAVCPDRAIVIDGFAIVGMDGVPVAAMSLTLPLSIQPRQTMGLDGQIIL